MSAPSISRNYCIYCGARAVTRDHVPPRLLLERPFPPNLRTVPSCLRCNHGASLDEQYFLTLIGQVSISASIAAKLESGGVIERTLARSPALEERLLNALGIDEQTGAPFIRPETARVNKVVGKIALGLFALRYGRIPPAHEMWPIGFYPYQTRDDRPWPIFIATITERFKSKPWRTVQRGVFSYIFVRGPNQGGNVWCIMDIHQSFWGVVCFENPKSGRAQRAQRRLFSEPDAT